MTPQNNTRRDKVNYYLDLAETVAENSTCLHNKCGAIIVNNDSIVSTGYTGAPRGRQNCTDLGKCTLDCTGFCRAVHSETNACISANRQDMQGGTLYLTRLHASDNSYIEDDHCCQRCMMAIINACLRDVYIRITKDTYVRKTVIDWVTNDETLEWLDKELESEKQACMEACRTTHEVPSTTMPD